MTYWLDLFTGKTWQEFLDARGAVSGFREGRWKAVQRMQPGDRLLCYLTGISRFVGVLEVTSDAFRDTKKNLGRRRVSVPREGEVACHPDAGYGGSRHDPQGAALGLSESEESWCVDSRLPRSLPGSHPRHPNEI